MIAQVDEIKTELQVARLPPIQRMRLFFPQGGL